MKKYLMYIIFLLLTTMCWAQTWETMTVETEEGTQSFIVDTENYFITQYSLQIDKNFGEAWFVLRTRSRLNNMTEWFADWAVEKETPVNFFTDKQDLMKIADSWIEKYAEVLEIENGKLLGVWEKDYWWEDRTYLMMQYNQYVIKDSMDKAH